MIRTYIDAGVLIAAARGEDDVAERALAVLEDSNREFLSSDFLRLEVLPKAIYGNRQAEAEFYEAFFETVVGWANDFAGIVEDAIGGASKIGLSAMDALHVASAKSVHADELVTTERTVKPIHRAERIRVVSIHPS